MQYFFKTILLIDDDSVDNIINEKFILENLFAENVIIRKSSGDALNFLKNESMEKNEIPDVIFLDIRMPLGNGFEFLESYEELPGIILSRTKIVMLTSSLDEDDHLRAIENKFVQFLLNKPLSFEILENLKRKL